MRELGAGWSRDIYPSSKSDIGSEVGVFTGIYGSNWLVNATENLDRQDLEVIRAVFAINGQNSESLNYLLKWQAETNHCVDIIVNKSNVGPLGSWYLNRELLEKPWRAQMHQDDVYDKHHVSTLVNLINQGPKDVVAVFTSMDRLDSNGVSRRAGPPLLGPKLSLEERPELFIEILRQQPFPAPTQCTRSDADPDDLAWYDSGAPDSEWFARLACRGRIMSTFEVTASYRESAESESHSTDWSTRAWLWAQSLQRIILSEDFMALVSELPVEKRSRFSERLLDAITARYPDGQIFGFLKFSAAQKLCEAWNYGEGSPIRELGTTLQSWGNSASVRNLSAIGKGSFTTEIDTDATPPKMETDLLGLPPRSSYLERIARSAYKAIGHWIPPRIRTRMFQFVQRHRGRTVST